MQERTTKERTEVATKPAPRTPSLKQLGAGLSGVPPIPQDGGSIRGCTASCPGEKPAFAPVQGRRLSPGRRGVAAFHWGCLRTPLGLRSPRERGCHSLYRGPPRSPYKLRERSGLPLPL